MIGRQSGDTIIEVILAVTVFSLVAVGTMTVMNQGAAMAQRSLEITQVRHQLDAQAEMLRYTHDQARQGLGYQSMWSDIKSHNIKNAGSQTSWMNIESCPTSLPDRGFALVASGAGGVSKTIRYKVPTVYAKVLSSGESEGISVQVTKVSGARAYDAYIQACWYAPGMNRPMTTGTIVRLYDPAA